MMTAKVYRPKAGPVQSVGRASARVPARDPATGRFVSDSRSPRDFYRQVTKQPDVRRILEKLANL